MPSFTHKVPPCNVHPSATQKALRALGRHVPYLDRLQRRKRRAAIFEAYYSNLISSQEFARLLDQLDKELIR